MAGGEVRRGGSSGAPEKAIAIVGGGPAGSGGTSAAAEELPAAATQCCETLGVSGMAGNAVKHAAGAETHAVPELPMVGACVRTPTCVAASKLDDGWRGGGELRVEGDVDGAAAVEVVVVGGWCPRCPTSCGGWEVNDGSIMAVVIVGRCVFKSLLLLEGGEVPVGVFAVCIGTAPTDWLGLLSMCNRLEAATACAISSCCATVGCCQDAAARTGSTAFGMGSEGAIGKGPAPPWGQLPQDTTRGDCEGTLNPDIVRLGIDGRGEPSTP